MAFFASAFFYISDIITAYDYLTAVAQQGKYISLSAANPKGTTNVDALAEAYPNEQVQHNLSSSQNETVVTFGSFPSAESLRLRNLFDSGFQEMAIEEALKYLKIYPLNLEIRQVLAQFYTQQKKDNLAAQQLKFINLWKTWDDGNRSAAINQALELIKTDPNNNDIVFALGKFYFSQNNYLLARQQFELVLQRDSHYTAARAALIDAYIATANNFQATIILNQGLQFGNALLQEEKRLIQHAEDTYFENAKTDFNEFILLWRLWDTGYRQQSIEQAIVYLNKNPDEIQIRLSLGQFYLMQKNYPFAKQQIAWVLEQNPNYVAARVSMIEFYLASNNFQEAQNVLNQGLVLSPGNMKLLETEKLIKNARELATPGGAALTLAEFNSIWKMWNSGQHPEAIEETKKYLKNHPDDAQIVLSLSQFYVMENKYPEAIQLINNLLDKDPTYVQARITLSDIYIATKDYDMAEKTVEQGLALLPGNDELVARKQGIKDLREFDTLWSLWNENKQNEAIKQANDYLVLNPNSAQVRLSLGQFFYLKNNYPLARQQIELVLAKDPTYVAARLSLIDVYLAMNNYDAATNQLDEGLKLSPTDPQLLQKKEAIAHAKTQPIQPALPLVSSQKMGDALAEFNDLWKIWKLGERSKAIAKASEYLKKNPDDQAVRLSLGQFYFLEKNYSQAIEQINQVLTKDKNYVAARASLIEVYIGLKNYKKASDILDQGLLLAPGDAVLLAEEKAIKNAKNPPPAAATSDLAEFNSLWQLWKSGKQEQTIAKASSYLQKKPNDAAVALSLGQFYLLQKKYTLAIQQINKVLTKNPTYIAARTTLIDAYIATKNYTQATTVLNKGLELSPHDSSLLQSKKLIQNAQTAKPLETVAAKLGLPAKSWSYIEGGVQYAKLTAGYGYWFNQYLKTVIQKDENNIWEVDALHGYEYGQTADYGLVQTTHNFNENWYGSLGAGISDNSIWVPKYYIGGSLARKFLKSKKLVGYLGFQSYWFRPIYKLETLNPGLIYYFNKPWVVEAGVYLNRSNPGSVDTAVGYIAVTQGRVGEHFLTLRGGWGREGYLPVIANSPIVGYPSWVVTGTWRQWVGKHWGWNIVGENYSNRFYNRYGVSFGLFKEFSV